MVDHPALAGLSLDIVGAMLLVRSVAFESPAYRMRQFRARGQVERQLDVLDVVERARLAAEARVGTFLLVCGFVAQSLAATPALDQVDALAIYGAAILLVCIALRAGIRTLERHRARVYALAAVRELRLSPTELVDAYDRAHSASGITNLTRHRVQPGNAEFDIEIGAEGVYEAGETNAPYAESVYEYASRLFGRSFWPNACLISPAFLRSWTPPRDAWQIRGFDLATFGTEYRAKGSPPRFFPDQIEFMKMQRGISWYRVALDGQPGVCGLGGQRHAREFVAARLNSELIANAYENILWHLHHTAGMGLTWPPPLDEFCAECEHPWAAHARNGCSARLCDCSAVKDE